MAINLQIGYGQYVCIYEACGDLFFGFCLICAVILAIEEIFSYVCLYDIILRFINEW